MAIENNTYNMSFVAGAAMMNETYVVAKAYLECDGDWNLAKKKTFRENLMEKDKLSSNQRYFLLMRQRIEALNEEEIQVLVYSTVAVRRAIVLLAICKAHLLIYDFITENVRDCFYNLHEKVTHANFNEFIMKRNTSILNWKKLQNRLWLKCGRSSSEYWNKQDLLNLSQMEKFVVPILRKNLRSS